MVNKVNRDLFAGAAQPHIFVLSPRCSTIPSLISLGKRIWQCNENELTNARKMITKNAVLFLISQVLCLKSEGLMSEV